MNLYNYLLTLLIFCFSYSNIVLAKDIPFYKRKDVQLFISDISKKHSLKKRQLTKLFKTVTIQPTVLEKIKNPYEEKPWHYYRDFFITQDRIQEGVGFWQNHADILAKAEQKYGVPKSIIVAIIGVESFYGKKTGDFKVLDTLATLTFEYPPRAKFFRSELVEFLLLCKENSLDPQNLFGSYAGAMGQPQFMPSSFRYYAVNFSNSGKIDLHNNNTDIIGSIGNYLKTNGWQRSKPITMPAKITKHPIKIPTNIFKPNLTIEQLTKYGIYPKHSLPKDTTATLLKLQGNNTDEYWLGFTNFYVITRYNISLNYAMTVYQLGQLIEKQYSKLKTK